MPVQISIYSRPAIDNVISSLTYGVMCHCIALMVLLPMVVPNHEDADVAVSWDDHGMLNFCRVASVAKSSTDS